MADRNRDIVYIHDITVPIELPYMANRTLCESEALTQLAVDIHRVLWFIMGTDNNNGVFRK